MTENADVQWLRETFGGYIPPEFNAFATREVYFMQMRRLLAHIDQLEAEVSKQKARANHESRIVENLEDKVARVKSKRRPTVHEIAPQMMAAVTPRGSFMPKEAIPECAAYAYDLAQALEAEGRRRDGK